MLPAPIIAKTADEGSGTAAAPVSRNSASLSLLESTGVTVTSTPFPRSKSTAGPPAHAREILPLDPDIVMLYV